MTARVLQLRAGSATLYHAATHLQRQALAAFLAHDYARSERLTEEAREMRREGDGALVAELRCSVLFTKESAR